jgi:hypothetical protein
MKKYWREGLILFSIIAFGLLWRSYKWELEGRRRAETEVQNAKVEMETFKSGVVQAQNDLVKSQKELIAGMSEEFQKELKEQKQKILAAVHSEIEIQFQNGGGEGTQDPNTPNKFTYSDQTMKSIQVNAQNPYHPMFTYQIAPITLGLEGTLNFDPASGQSKFWVLPSVKNGPPNMDLKVGRMELTPSPEFNNWITEMRDGRIVYVPAVPKWSLGVQGGYNPALGNREFGMSLYRNFSNGLGVGGGSLGNTAFIGLTYSWGKQ